MKFKHFLPLCALALPLCAAAVPAKPGLMPTTLADGTKVMIEAHGDEFFHYVTDEQGFLLTRTPQGQLTYKLDPNGARLSATPLVIDELRLDALQSLPMEMRRSAANGGPSRMAPLNKQGRTTFPTVGDNHFLVLLVEYSDLKWSVDDPVKVMNDKLNGENYDYMGSVGSMRQYYIENSGGKFQPTFDIVGPITLPKTNAYYVGEGKYDNIQECVTTAARLADEQFGVDFSKYDIDNDGYIDNVIIFYAGYGAADTSGIKDKYGEMAPPAIWPHNSSVANLYVKLDDKLLGNYCCFNELNGAEHFYNRDGVLDGIGTPVHEFGHVLGMPDLYDPNYEVKATPGVWSVMDAGCYNEDGYVPCNNSGYERWVFNWLDYDVLDESGHYELESLHNQGKVWRMNMVDNAGDICPEYFLMESRDKNSFDSGLPYGGMLIWHINYDANIWRYNQVNSTFSNMRCHLLTADGTANYELNNAEATANAAWPQKINYITPDTDIRFYGKYPLCFGPQKHFMTSIAYDPETGVSSFDYDVITKTPEETTVMLEPTRLKDDRGNDTNTIRLSWDAVDGADGYKLTVYRKTSTGTKFYESALDDREIGNVTSYDLTFASNKMNIAFYAYVRPIVTIPSQNISNEIAFVPNNVSTGIEEVITEEDVPVRGLQGAIDAPASARVFTLTGAPAGRDNLSAGIYLVQVGARTYKVIVK